MNNEVERYPGELRILREKVSVYESLLHNIQLFSVVTMDNQRLTQLIEIVNGWSYAHRSGNGELSELDQQSEINLWFDLMRNRAWSQKQVD